MAGMPELPRWWFDYVIDGQHTLDPVKDAGAIRRIANRKALFIDPLVRSGYLQGKRILDLGCNSGFWSLSALKEGGAAFARGIEADPVYHAQAEQVFKAYGVEADRYQFILSDAYRHLEADIDEYDLVLCLGFFYHIDDPSRLLKLMAARCPRGIVVIDTVVHSSPEALVSVRPVETDTLIPDARISVELVSSPKALAWMGSAAGLRKFRVIRGEYERITSMWDYLKGERSAFALSAEADLDTFFPDSEDPGYLMPSEDLAKYGYFPEMRQGRNAKI